MKQFSILLLALALFGCQKTEGPGGQAMVHGKIYAKEYNASFTQLVDEYYASEKDVYIMYGDHEVYDDDMKTNFDGTFEFKYLTKGKYTIFVYSKDSTFSVPGGSEPIFMEFEITDKKEIVDLGEIPIFD
jgi:hypothetical protein